MHVETSVYFDFVKQVALYMIIANAVFCHHGPMGLAVSGSGWVSNVTEMCALTGWPRQYATSENP